MQFAELQHAILDLSPVQIDADLAGRLVNRAYQDVAALHPWFGLKAHTWLTSVAPKRNGTVTLTRGSATVVGSGTSFAATDVGRYLKVGDRHPLRIASVASPTTLTLEVAWGEASLANTPYEIVSLRYPLPADADRILRIQGPTWFLVRRSQSLIDAYDPTRKLRGVPLVFAETEQVGVANPNPSVVEVELWPVPEEEVTFAVSYRKRIVPLKDPHDQPILPMFPILIQRHAQAEACRLLFSYSGQPRWLQLAEQYEQMFTVGLQAAIQEDRRLRGSHPVALDIDDTPNWTDPSWRAWFRYWQTLGLSSVSGTS